jgi:hypothetical protein
MGGIERVGSGQFHDYKRPGLSVSRLLSRLVGVASLHRQLKLLHHLFHRFIGLG